MVEESAFFKEFFSQCPSEKIQLEEFDLYVYTYKGKRILLAQTGLGTTFAGSVLTWVYYHLQPEYVFLTGTAGAIKSGLKLRDVIIVEKAFEAEVQKACRFLEGTPFESCLTHPLKNERVPLTYLAGEELIEIANQLDFPLMRVHKGTVVSSNAFPAPQELFSEIKNEDPYSIDMETSAFYQVAWLFKIPVLAVRGISNILHHDGTDEKIHESDVKGSSEAAAKVLLKIVDKLLLKLSTIKEVTINHEVEKIVKDFDLKPHPEGGYYKRSFQSTAEMKSLDKNRYHDEPRYAGTAIYYLLKGHDFSAWHRLKSDEIWHYCRGSSVKLYVINPRGELSTHLLGDSLLQEGARFQVAIPADHWFAAEVIEKDSYALVGCTVSPGFEFKDFELADRKMLIEKFPQHIKVITRFTRVPDETVEKVNETTVAETQGSGAFMRGGLRSRL